MTQNFIRIYMDAAFALDTIDNDIIVGRSHLANRIELVTPITLGTNDVMQIYFQLANGQLTPKRSMFVQGTETVNGDTWNVYRYDVPQSVLSAVSSQNSTTLKVQFRVASIDEGAGNPVDTGTVTSASTNTLSDSAQAWTVNEYSNHLVRIVQGTGVNQTRQIVSNTATALTVATNWTTTPDATSDYEIVPIADVYFALKTSALVNLTLDGAVAPNAEDDVLVLDQSDYDTLAGQINNKLNKDFSLYTEVLTPNNDDTLALYEGQNSTKRIKVGTIISQAVNAVANIGDRVTILEGWVDQDVSVASSPDFNNPTVDALSLNDGGATTDLTKTKLDGIDTHVASTSNPHSVTKAQVGLSNVDNTTDLGKPISTATQTALNLKVNTSELGVTVATLTDGKVPANQLPSFVDDVVEYGDISLFPGTGENSKIYVALDTGKIYRWSGTQYIEISASEVTGVKGNSELTFRSGQVNITKANIGLGNVADVAQVTDVTGTAPIVSSGGTTPAISITAATTLVPGSMSASDKSKLDGIDDNANNYQHPDHSGDVTSSGDGATTISNSAVTLAKMANLDANSIIGNDTASPIAPKALTASEVRTLLNVEDGAQVNVATNLGVGNKTTISLDVTSSTGTDVSIPQATTTEAGLLVADDKTKLNYLTVTANTDLDDIRTRVGQLSSAVVLRGTWDASAGTFPGGGTAIAGDSYIISTGGTVDNIQFTVGDRIVALVNDASTTVYATNWLKQDYTDQVSSVNGEVGAVVLDSTEIDTVVGNFNKLLGSADDTIQKALDTLDDHTHTESDITDLDKYTQTQVDNLLNEKVDVTALSSTLIIYPTTADSDITGYKRLVSDIGDSDYDTVAVNIPTGQINADGQLISSLIADAALFIGNPGIINITTLGKIRKVGGNNNQNASFYYELYKRDSGGTEVLIATSDNTGIVEAENYEEFFASALLNNGNFLATDRVVIKYYGDVEEGAGASYEFEFGGSTPVRTLLPVPVAVKLQAEKVFYDNSGSRLTSINVEAAINELDDALEEAETLITIQKFVIDAVGGSTFDYTVNDVAVTGVGYTGTAFPFTLGSSEEYVTGNNRLTVKYNDDKVYYSQDEELTETSTTVFTLDLGQALQVGDEIYARIYQGLTTVSIAIGDASITEAKLAGNAVTETKIANGAVTNSKIANGSVTTAKIVDNNVTWAKVEQVNAQSILGNKESSAGNVQELTVAETKTLLALDNVNNTTDMNKPVSTATQTQLDKVNNASYLYAPTNPESSDLSLNLTNGLNPNAIITIKVPATLLDDAQNGRLSIDNAANYYNILDSGLNAVTGANLVSKTLRLQWDAGNTRFIQLDLEEKAYEAYSWGDHAQEGYLTSFTESDPVFSASEAANITSTDTTNWNTAYGWGDHGAETYENTNNKVTAWSDPVTNTNYASEKLVKDTIDSKPDDLGDLGDVDLTTEAPAQNDLLKYDGTNWTPQTLVENDIPTLGQGKITDLTSDLQAKATTVSYSTTIAAADTWTDTNGIFTLAKTVTGMLSTDNPVADLELSGIADPVANVATIQTAWALIYRIVTSSNTVTFYATAQPTFPEDTDVQFKVVR